MYSSSDIFNDVNDGRLKIEPLNWHNLGPASVDLCLDNKFLMPNTHQRLMLDADPADDEDIVGAYQPHTAIDTFLLHSGQVVLAQTKEHLTLPPDLCGILDGKSRHARIGLSVHSTASMIQPGFEGVIVLELTNNGKLPIRLRVGQRIAQLRFHRLDSEPLESTTGRYDAQPEVRV